MIVFSLKLLNNVRKAIAGRRFPRQLAGGVALGALLGIVPHGNLLALFVLLAILCFRVNHAVMAVIAIIVSFSATRLDPYSHQVGEYLLTHPTGHDIAIRAWSMPVVPWTDLNNTVVLGSFVIGLLSVLPIYFVTLPVFKLIAPAESDASTASDQQPQSDRVAEADPASKSGEVKTQWRTDVAHDSNVSQEQTDTPAPAFESAPSRSNQRGPEGQHSVTLFVEGEQPVSPPRFASAPVASDSNVDGGDAEPDRRTIPIDSLLASQTGFFPAEENEPAKTESTPAENEPSGLEETTPADAANELPTTEQMVAVDTRIDVIRIKDYQGDADSGSDAVGENTKNETEQPMDEALNYLLRQLRHSQERKAAG